jgi:P27 family predicted phage terminase small subunit
MVAGRPGRPRKPTALRLIDGNPGQRGLNSREPVYNSPALPDPPDDLGEFGSAEWLRMGALLLKKRVMTEADWMGFHAYCVAVDIYKKALLAHRRVEARDPVTFGLLMKTTNGNAVQSELSNLVVKWAKAMHTGLREFGLTPQARASLLAGEDDGDADEFFS